MTYSGTVVGKTLRIAICIGNSLMGGVANSTSLLCRGFLERGQDVEIIVTERTRGAYFDEIRHLRKLPIKAICEGDLWLRDRLMKTFEVLQQVDVILNNQSHETRTVLPALPKRIVKIAITRGMTDRVIRWNCYNSKALDSIVGVSPLVADKLTAAGSFCRVDMIPNAVDCPLGGGQKPGKQVDVAFVGRLCDKDKHVLLIPEIIQRLCARGVNVRCFVAGDGPDRKKLENLISQNDLMEHFELLGALSHEDACALMRLCHFLLMPSHHEAFGLVLAEAMAAGCVPVVSNLRSFSFVLGDNATLLQVSKSDADAYAETIQKLTLDPGCYKQLQVELIHHYCRQFTSERLIEDYLQLIEELRELKDLTCSTTQFQARFRMPVADQIRCTVAYRKLQALRPRNRAVLSSEYRV